MKALRENYELTQAQVAQALNLSRSQYTALEKGRSMLTYDHLCGLARVYKMDVSTLMSERVL